MAYSSKQSLKIVLALFGALSTLNSFVESRVVPVNDINNQVENNVSKHANIISLPVVTIIAVSFCVSFGSLICLKRNKKSKNKKDKSKSKSIDLSLPRPSTVPQKKDNLSEGSQSDIVNQSTIRLKPIINERSVSIRRSIIIEKDYSSYCGFSPFPAPGFQFIAIYDYEAQSEDEISLTKNDPLLISTTFEDGWTIGKNIKNDQIGFFPITCLGIGPIEDESNEPTDLELNLFNQMIVPNGRRKEE